MKQEELLELLNIKADESFRFDKIQSVNHNPHPYCISEKHLEYNDSTYLGKDNILRMEKKHGPMCGMYTNGSDWTNRWKSGYKRCTLSYKEHTYNTVIFVKCFKEDWNRDLFKQIAKENETEINKIAEGFVFVRGWND